MARHKKPKRLSGGSLMLANGYRGVKLWLLPDELALIDTVCAHVGKRRATWIRLVAIAAAELIDAQLVAEKNGFAVPQKQTAPIAMRSRAKGCQRE